MDFGFLGGLGFYTRDSSAGAPFRLSGTFPRRPERMKEWAAAEALDSPARAGLSGGGLPQRPNASRLAMDCLSRRLSH